MERDLALVLEREAGSPKFRDGKWVWSTSLGVAFYQFARLPGVWFYQYDSDLEGLPSPGLGWGCADGREILGIVSQARVQPHRLRDKPAALLALEGYAGQAAHRKGNDFGKWVLHALDDSWVAVADPFDSSRGEVCVLWLAEEEDARCVSLEEAATFLRLRGPGRVAPRRTIAADLAGRGAS